MSKTLYIVNKNIGPTGPQGIPGGLSTNQIS